LPSSLIRTPFVASNLPHSPLILHREKYTVPSGNGRGSYRGKRSATA
jgi:hypothetical protein